MPSEKTNEKNDGAPQLAGRTPLCPYLYMKFGRVINN
jgi:hypothetical protein